MIAPVRCCTTFTRVSWLRTAFVLCTLTPILLVLLTADVTAQRRNNVWYFGSRVGLDFNTSPPTPLQDGAMSTNEGTASIADEATGELLFYTNGVTVWDRHHTMMTNGYSLGGNYSTSQSALIIPVPGDSARYYIFTNGPRDRDAEPNEGMVTWIRYSIVDMRLGNGDGAVVEKNVLLLDSTTEHLHAVALYGEKEFWVVTHKWASDEFCAMKVNAAGIGAPVFSRSGPWIGGSTANSIGCLKLSRDGRRLALSQYTPGTVYLFNFNTATGAVSNAVTLIPRGLYRYGLCFSPDGALLYCGGLDLSQFNVRAGTAAQIIASRIILSDRINEDDTPFWATLTLGPDMRIYCAAWGYSYVGVIEQPNVVGAGCTLVKHGIELNRRVEMGLPNMVDINLPPPPDTVRNLTFHLPTLCRGNTRRVSVPFYNQRTTDSAVEIVFLGPRAGDYTLDTTLPFLLTPTNTITFPVIHRWTTPGTWATTARIRSSSGTIYLVDLKAITEEAITPVLDISSIHLGERAGPFDTCITVTNTYHTRLVLSDTAWTPAGVRHLKLVSPSLPVYLPKGASVRLCLQGMSFRRGDTLTLTIGGTILDSNEIGHCMAQVLSIDSEEGPGTAGTGEAEKLTAGVRCFPNPANGALSVTFTVREPGRVRIRLLSADGRTMATLGDAQMEAGDHRADLDVSRFPSGSYAVSVELPEGVRAVPVVLVH